MCECVFAMGKRVAKGYHAHNLNTCRRLSTIVFYDVHLTFKLVAFCYAFSWAARIETDRPTAHTLALAYFSLNKKNKRVREPSTGYIQIHIIIHPK